MSLAEQKPGLSDQDRVALIDQERRTRIDQNSRLDDVQVSFATVEQFIREFPQARATQSELLESLRKVGVLAPIEKLSGIQIPPIPFDNNDHLYLCEQSRERSSKLSLGFDGDVVYIPAPTLNNRYGIWMDSVRLYVIHTKYKAGEPADAVAALVLSYSSEHLLRVNGMSYIGHKLAEDTDFRKKVVKDVKAAYHNGLGPIYDSRISITSDRRVLNIHKLD